MTSDFALGLRAIISMGWGLLTSFYIPGTNITPAALLLFSSVTYISLKFLVNLFGTGGLSSTNVVHAQRTREGRPKRGSK